MGKFAISALILLSSCSANYHVRRAEYHLSKLDSSKAAEIRTDSTARKIRFKGARDSFTFGDVPNIPIVLKGKNGVEIKYLRTQSPGVPDSSSLSIDCPDTTITVYDTKEVVVYRTEASFKEFIKQWLGISNFQFNLYLVLICIVTALFLLKRIFR